MTEKRKYKLALCQIMTHENKEENLERTGQMIRQAREQEADVVILPEMFACPNSHHYFRLYAETEKGPSVRRLADFAHENGVILIGGSLPELDGKELYNTCFVFDETGRQIAKYRKTHMFDIELAGGKSFRESRSFSRGNDICVFNTSCGKMGVAICFDIRFPELVRSMALWGAELIAVPAQFTYNTGKQHWSLIMQSKALDNELYVAAASTARNNEFAFCCWGHSMVAGPLGSILQECDETEQMICVDIDRDKIIESRNSLPTFMHLRDDLYQLPVGKRDDI